MHWGNPPFPERNRDDEMRLMGSALRRLHLRGRLDEVYDKPWESSTTVHVTTTEEIDQMLSREAGEDA